MPKITKIKTAAAAHPVAQNRDEVVSMIARIGQHQRDRERLKHEMDEQITALRERYDRLMAPHVDAIKGLGKGVQTWCEANRSDITHNGKTKTVNLMTGEVRWRVTPPSCKLIRVREAMEELKQKLLSRFIRTKEEINKEAILADPTAIADCSWIKIEQSEDFVIVPFETELEEVA